MLVVPAPPNPFCDSNNPSYSSNDAADDYKEYIKDTQVQIQCVGCELSTDDGCELSISFPSAPGGQMPKSTIMNDPNGPGYCWVYGDETIEVSAECSICQDTGGGHDGSHGGDSDSFTTITCGADDDVDIAPQDVVVCVAASPAHNVYARGRQAWRDRISQYSEAFGFECGPCEDPAQCQPTVTYPDDFELDVVAAGGVTNGMRCFTFRTDGGTVSVECGPCEEGEGDGDKTGQHIGTGAQSLDDILMYPNPSAGSTWIAFTYDGTATSARMVVTDLKGAQVLEISYPITGVGNYLYEIPSGTLATGIYNATLSVGGKHLHSERLAITK